MSWLPVRTALAEAECPEGHLAMETIIQYVIAPFEITITIFMVSIFRLQFWRRIW